MFKNILFISSVFILIGCNSSDITITEPIIPPPQNKDKIIINEANSDFIIASTISSIGILRDSIEKIPKIDIDKISEFTSNELIGDINLGLDISDIADICKDGGKAILNSASSTSANITFQECKDDNKILNGNIDFQFEDKVYHLVLNQFSYDSNSYFEQANITYDERGDRKDIDAFLSSGFFIDNGENISLKNTTFKKISQNYILNGELGTGCLGGVILVKTVEAVSAPDNKCPDSGKLYAVGGGSSTLGITFNKNMSIETFLNNEIKEYYNSCTDLPVYSDICL